MKRVLFIGRFQPIHIGHVSVLHELVHNGFDEIILGVGSAQYERELNNPFSYAEREQMILDVISSDNSITLPVHVIAIPDIHNDKKWVAHVDAIVNEHAGDYTAVYTGNKIVDQLFAEQNRVVYPVSKSIGITATQIRSMVRDNDDAWKEYVPSVIHNQVSQIASYEYGRDKE